MSVLPYNEDAEDHVVGAAITNEKALQAVAEVIEPTQLFRPRHRRILQTALAMYDAGQPVDLVTLLEQLGDEDRQTARELAVAGFPAANVRHHAAIVADYHVRRRLIEIGQTLARYGYEAPEPVPDMLADAETMVYDLTTATEVGELRPIAETLPETFRTLDRPGGEITGTPTGLRDLDTLTAGFQPGNLIVVAARPGMGKSALAIQASHYCAVTLDLPVALFTLEMSAQEINQRLLSLHARVPLMRIRTRNGLTVQDRVQLAAAGDKLEQAPLYVDDTVSARLVDVRARARRLKQKHPTLGMIVVDYLQLMLTDTRDETRNLEVARLSRGLKLLARETGVPVMALAQLNRNVEHRAEKTPMLSDLRDSGAIEQDADVVLFIHRTDGDDGELAHLTIAKHRNGPTGEIKTAWMPRQAVFAPLAMEGF